MSPPASTEPGAALRAWRRRHGLSQADVGAAIGLTQKRYMAIENGNAPLRPLHIRALRDLIREVHALRGAIPPTPADLIRQTRQAAP